MYNVKITHYPNGSQVNIYNQMVGYSSSIKSDPCLVSSTYDEFGNVVCDITSGTSVPDFSIMQDDSGLHIVSKKNDSDRSKSVSLNRTKNMVYYLARSNIWDWFVTLTFNPEFVDSFNYDDVTKHLHN